MIYLCCNKSAAKQLRSTPHAPDTYGAGDVDVRLTRERAQLMFLKPNVKKLAAQNDVHGLVKALKHRDYVVQEKARKALKAISGQITTLCLCGVK